MKEIFIEDAVYSVDEVAKILNRNPRTVRDLCRRKLLSARSNGRGYLIGGWAIKEYVSGRLVIDN